jgi:hypothetical protein
VTLRARWVTLRARWVTLRARWVTLRARWVTLRARWGTLRDFSVMLRDFAGDVQVTEQAVLVLTELVLKHQKVLRDGKVLSKLPMMPELPSLKKVNAALELERGALPLPQRLLLLTESLEANSLAVRLVALKQLQLLARERRAELYAFFLQVRVTPTHKQPLPLGDAVERGCTPSARSITTVMLHQL